MKVFLKPGESKFRNLFQCAGFFKEMRSARHDHKTFRTGEEPEGCSIHLDDRLVVSTHNQQSRRGDRREIGFGQIRSAAP
jgi:hypothetical protein